MMHLQQVSVSEWCHKGPRQPQGWLTVTLLQNKINSIIKNFWYHIIYDYRTCTVTITCHVWHCTNNTWLAKISIGSITQRVCALKVIQLTVIRKWYVSNALKIEVSISLRDSTTSLLVVTDLWPTTPVLVYHFLSQLDTTCTYQPLQGINAE